MRPGPPRPRPAGPAARLAGGCRSGSWGCCMRQGTEAEAAADVSGHPAGVAVHRSGDRPALPCSCTLLVSHALHVGRRRLTTCPGPPARRAASQGEPGTGSAAGFQWCLMSEGREVTCGRVGHAMAQRAPSKQMLLLPLPLLPPLLLMRHSRQADPGLCADQSARVGQHIQPHNASGLTSVYPLLHSQR